MTGLRDKKEKRKSYLMIVVFTDWDPLFTFRLATLSGKSSTLPIHCNYVLKGKQERIHEQCQECWKHLPGCGLAIPAEATSEIPCNAALYLYSVYYISEGNFILHSTAYCLCKEFVHFKRVYGWSLR